LSEAAAKPLVSQNNVASWVKAAYPTRERSLN